MSMPGIREKATASLIAAGHKPKTRGGNGKPPSLPEQRLASALGRPWRPVVVPTGGRIPGLRPTHYKIDLGHEELKIAIELDGNSHLMKVRKAADKRKDEFLRSQGWSVLRFLNEEILNDLVSVLQKVKKLKSSISR